MVDSPQQHETADAASIDLFAALPGVVYQCSNDDARTVRSMRGNCDGLIGHTQNVLVSGELCWSGFTHPEDREFVTSTVQAALSADHAFDIQYRIVDATGREKWVRERGIGIAHGNKAPALVQGYIEELSHPQPEAAAQSASERATFLMDNVASINAQIKSQTEMGRQREQLAHADRLYTLGEMATGIAHEINQPLAAISLFAQAGNRLLESQEYDSLPEIFDKLSQHAHRAGTIVERIQSLARSKEPGKGVIDLNLLARDVVDLAEMDAQTSGIEIVLACTPGSIPVKVDIVQIQQVTLNLIRNAIDAMRSLDSGGGNTIEVATIRLDDAYLQLSVTDSGGGVPSDIADSLFEPFLTTKHTGLGMGLPISQAIINAHGGRLQHWNHSANGATFAFALPPAPSGERNE